MEEKFREYARLKEERLRELLKVIEPSLILRHLSFKMCRSGKAGFELIERTNDVELLLAEFSHFRIIEAIRKMGYPFYTDRLQSLRNELYRDNYGLICDAIWNTLGTLNQDLVSVATVAFLEAIDNVSTDYSGKPQTYVFTYVSCKLREAVGNLKKGMLLLTYLKRFCGVENAEELIAKGDVKVNGKVCYNRKQVVSLEDEILIGDERPFSSSKVVSFEPTGTVTLFSGGDQFGSLQRKEFWDVVRSVAGDEGFEVLYLKSCGYSSSEIADELGISIDRVKNIVKTAMSRLRKNRNEFAGFSF